MNYNYKKFIAREWLFLISFFFLGFFIKISFNYLNSIDYSERREQLYNILTQKYNEKIGPFAEFSAQLDDSQKRKELYNRLSKKYDLGNYELFEIKLTRSRFSNAIHKFIDEKNTLKLFLVILLPYFIFLFIRTIIWSIKTIMN